MYIDFIKLGTLKHIQQSHENLSPVPLTSLSVDKILAEFIQAGCRQFVIGSIKLVNSIWYKEELSQVWNQSFHLLIRRVEKQTAVIIEAPYSYQAHTKRICNIFFRG
jgi:hypothetical protein